MSFGGDGVIRGTPFWPVSPKLPEEPFALRKFGIGGRLSVRNSHGLDSSNIHTCVLCGGLIIGQSKTYEHPFPQWLYKYCDQISGNVAHCFAYDGRLTATWRQLCLASHESCNEIFGRKIEEPARKPIIALVEGRRVTSADFDLIFDWLDKVKSSVVHMGTALRGHALAMDYDPVSFPDKRIGMFDRLAVLMRVNSDKQEALEIWDCLGDAFLTTPSAIAVRIRDLIIVYVSGNYLLSDAFGLGRAFSDQGLVVLENGDGKRADGLGSRKCRIRSAEIIAQPMRRQHLKCGLSDRSRSLKKNGDGHIFKLDSDNRWERLKSISISKEKIADFTQGHVLASIELIEWTILCKELDNKLYGKKDAFFMRSYEQLFVLKNKLIETYLCITGIKLIGDMCAGQTVRIGRYELNR